MLRSLKSKLPTPNHLRGMTLVGFIFCCVVFAGGFVAMLDRDAQKSGFFVLLLPLAGGLLILFKRSDPAEK